MLRKLNEKFDKNVNRTLLVLSFLTYFFILIWIIIFKLSIPELVEPAFISLEKGVTISDNFFLSFQGAIDFDFIDMIINILSFVPLGLYLPLLFNKFNLVRDLIISFFLSLLFETSECLSRLGCFDYKDILINVAGALIGLIIFYYLKPLTSNKTINYIQLFIVLAFLIIAIHIPIAIYKHWDIYEPFFDFDKYPYTL